MTPQLEQESPQPTPQKVDFNSCGFQCFQNGKQLEQDVQGIKKKTEEEKCKTDSVSYERKESSTLELCQRSFRGSASSVSGLGLIILVRSSCRILHAPVHMQARAPNWCNKPAMR